MRLQSTSAKCCRLLITIMLNGGIWFAVIGPQPERKERPPVTEILLNKQALSQPIKSIESDKSSFTLSVMAEGFWSHFSLTPTVSTLKISSIKTRMRGNQKHNKKMYVSSFYCHKMLEPLLPQKATDQKRKERDEEISDYRRIKRPEYEAGCRH